MPSRCRYRAARPGATTAAVPAVRTSRSLALAAQYVQARTGIDLSGAPSRHALDHLEAALEASGAAGVDEYVRRLAAEPALFDTLVDRITVQESYFFRDPQHFDFVAAEVLPKVRERLAAGGSGLRAFSAGCAAGEEAYSLAILLHEQGLLQGAHLIAGDVSRAALARARAGLYRPWALRGPGERARPYLAPRDGKLELDVRLRSAVTFLRINLAGDLYPSTATGLHDLDLVLCRNVLIYFDAQSIAGVAERLFASLAEGGWLIAGPSDPMLGELAPFEVLVRDEGVIYRRPLRRAPAPARRSSPARASQPPAPAASLRQLAETRPEAVLEATAGALSDPELLYLRAALLIALDRSAEAEPALRQLLAVDPDAALGHFLLADLALRRADVELARQAFRDAAASAHKLGADEPLPYGDGELAGRLASAAERRLEALEGRR